MSFYIDAAYESLNKYNEELCGDKIEIIRNKDSVVIVLADGLGSGVKANILATMTSKIIGTFMINGLNIDEAVETIADTLPVCKDRGIAYSTFSILQIFYSGEGYLVEYDNPAVFALKRGKTAQFDQETRVIGGKIIKESRFTVKPNDLFIMVSDGVVHAGIGQTLNLGWQWEHVDEYIRKTNKTDMSAKGLAKLLISACDNLYAHKPGDDTTVAAIKIKKPVTLNIMVGPPKDRDEDDVFIHDFINLEGKKVICGGTTAQVASRVLKREIVTSFDYFNPEIPPTAKIEGIDLTTEGVLTLGKALEQIRIYSSSDSTMKDLLGLNEKDGASMLSKILLEESTSINFFVGRAANPAHQTPEAAISLSAKLKLVEKIASYLRELGKQVTIQYH
ncbi:SpoIIE family protein phosphatase [Anoxybacterium hadale]|uniref:SpoIIE family protein phosphatase n=1 Tax=Anoxybacterium hadale TaxID=3408580 RepID=A0ACD1ACM9_9FIRM|nr:SpoIIE family protein phosphatase [Clostridiales bacterium]